MAKGPETTSMFGADWSPAAQQMQKPGIVRALTYARLLTSTGAALVVIVGGLQFIMPEGNKPADWFGNFHGGIESAEIRTKQTAVIEMKRREAEEVAREQAKVQWELTVLTKQMESLHESLTAKSDIANGADWLCIIGRMVPQNVDNRDVRETGKALRGACGYSDQIRTEQQEAYAQLARRHSALVARDDELHRKLVLIQSR